MLSLDSRRNKQDSQDYPVQYIKGIGPKRAKLLARLGIKTLEDAIFYLPYRYEDRRIVCKIADCKFNTFQSAFGKVIYTKLRDIPKRKMKIYELIITDGSSVLTGKWFNQPYMDKIFKVGDKVVLSGIMKRNNYWGIGFEMLNPEYEILKDETENLHVSRIVPIYKCTSGLSTRNLRSIMYNIILFAYKSLDEYMPVEILRKYNLPSIKEAIMNLHFPYDGVSVDALNKGITEYHKRIAFDELFFLQIGLCILKNSLLHKKGISFNAQGKLLKKMLQNIPFTLTNAQKRVIEEILHDMKKPYPMNRLLQGDVGSGKTIVAMAAILQAVESGYQAVMMAPTEILAEQHYFNIYPLVEKLGLKCELLTRSCKKRPLEQIASGELNIIIGTHALLQENIKFKNLGIVIIDEQHRFGVLQRASLRKKGKNPDVLIMTATPIPRTLSLTFYGDLDYSVIDEMPPDRKPVITKLYTPRQKEEIYKIMLSELKKGRQAYIVYPTILESEKLKLRSAVVEKEILEKVFPKFKIGLLHGRMKSSEREEIMMAFKNKQIDILVSTTVIEVGVDVPNASLMLIEHAERFGLAQLHQLRGRVGRGPYQSYCFLVAYGKLTEEAKRRLEVIVKYSDGFKIAEQDIKIRGPGEILGTKQSGMPEWKIADLIRDTRLLTIARKEAFNILKECPNLNQWPKLKKMVEKFWKGKIEIFKTS